MIIDNVSWGQFAGVAGVGVAIYYGYLVLTGKVKIRIPSQTPETAATAEPKKAIWRREITETPLIDDYLPPTEVTAHMTTTEQESPEDDEEDQAFIALQMLAGEVQEIIADTQTYPTKESLMERLAMEVNRYPVLQEPALRSAIGNIIIKAAKVDRDIEISKAETEALWGQPA